jgi:hypothetical protein
MPVAGGPNTLGESNLVFAYDTGDVQNSYRGRPTVNVSAGLGLNNYNNVGGNVSTSITPIGQTYKGAEIYQQTLIPLDASGVSYLTNGNNPGIGVYHGGGGGTGGQYSGHTIFFKPVGPMHSSPIFTHYSNIGGWQSTSNYEDMGDGWFRAKVLWYSASTLSDQKFWAINPAGAAINVPITIYWAGPFKENLNSTTISQFVEGTRSATQGLLPVIGNSTLDLTNVSFDSNAQMIFDGTNDYINIPSSNVFDTQTVTVEVIVKPYSTSQNGFWFEKGAVNTQYSLFMEGSNIQWRTAYGGTYDSLLFGSSNMTANAWNHVVGTYTAGDKRVYLNSNLMNSNNLNVTLNTNQGNQYIGSYNSNGYFYSGEIAIVKVYNRVLTAQEIKQNYQQYKTRFNLS